MKEIEAFLSARGFQRFPAPDGGAMGGTKVLFQRRLYGVVPVCQCNDKLHLNITLYEADLSGVPYESAECDITGEMPDGEWAKLSVYSVKPSDLPAKLDNLTERLIAAWMAACALAPATVAA